MPLVVRTVVRTALRTLPRHSARAAAWLLALPSLASLAIGDVRAADYVQTRGSTLEFNGTFQNAPFTGAFPGFRAQLRFDPDDLKSAHLDVAIPMAMSTTHRTDYDNEMRAAWFLDVAEFPTARYVADHFRPLGSGQYVADGTLTLRGVSRPVALTFKWTPGTRPVLSGTAKVRRLDYGVGTRSDWASSITDDIGIATRVVFVAK